MPEPVQRSNTMVLRCVTYKTACCAFSCTRHGVYRYKNILSISELTGLIKENLEKTFGEVWVRVNYRM